MQHHKTYKRSPNISSAFLLSKDHNSSLLVKISRISTYFIRDKKADTQFLKYSSLSSLVEASLERHHTNNSSIILGQVCEAVALGKTHGPLRSIHSTTVSGPNSRKLFVQPSMCLSLHNTLGSKRTISTTKDNRGSHLAIMLALKRREKEHFTPPGEAIRTLGAWYAPTGAPASSFAQSSIATNHSYHP